MECFICSANLENVQHRHFRDDIFCMTCEFEFVTATYTLESTFMIPKAWKKEDYYIKWDTLFYKGEEMDYKIRDAEDDSEAYKRPSNEIITENGEIFDCEEFFDCDCEESEQEESEQV